MANISLGSTCCRIVRKSQSNFNQPEQLRSGNNKCIARVADSLGLLAHALARQYRHSSVNS
jgi:hypothetical protein